MIKTPSTTEKRWTQTNSGDLFGELFMSRNMDFDKEGYASLAKRSRAIYSATLSAFFGRVSCIEYYDATSEYFVFTNDRPFKLSFASNAVTVTDESATSNMPSMDLLCRNDMVNWQGYLYATSTSSLRRYNGSWSIALTGTGFTGVTDGGLLCVFKNKNSLAVSQLNTVLLLDTSHNLTITLTLPTELVVTSMDWNNNLLYVGTRNTSNGDAILFTWDGTTTSANNGYPVGTHRIDSVKAYQSSCVVFTSKGKLRFFTGNGFQEMAGLPISFTDYQWDVSGSTVQGRVISRGMVVDNEKIYVHLSPSIFLNSNASNSPQLFDWFPGGVWCFDPRVGLYPKYPNSSSLRVQTAAVTTANVDSSTNIITTSSVPNTGTPVIYDSAGSTVITGLIHRKKYYVINLSSTTMKLATTYENALNGTAIDITGTGNNSQYFVFLPNRDFGGNSKELSSSIVGSGSGILLLKPQSSVIPATSDATKIIFGGRIGPNVVNGEYVLDVAADTQENRGFIVTQKLQAFSIKDLWQTVGVKYSGIKTAEDKIILKYRVVERYDQMSSVDSNVSQTATWVNSTSFTTTADISSAVVGDEITFHAGSGAGYIAHITVISLNAGTYTVTIDETVQNITGGDTASFTIANFTKLGVITTSDVDSYTNNDGSSYSSTGGENHFKVDRNSKWIQVKVEVRGEDVRLEEVYLNNISYKKYLRYE